MKYKDICRRFREVRIKHNLTQAEMAKLVGLSPQAVGAIENAAYTPSFTVMRILKRKLGVKYDWLIDGE